ncbi:uncharacterized protein LOC106157920 [Lingula anatina]|uniref:Uncharacterized protein LOC106157920 n=1 Tax=Lingula anatina TaxID=7574 RepID=A0A1S3HUF1_LINAN|nr:uncharacterized protein LOC106157920 [Lingula anatina]|eukprot:XP_013389171.1 uncharacterized protein LOC106157920 [Lingula anatina]
MACFSFDESGMSSKYHGSIIQFYEAVSIHSALGTVHCCAQLGFQGIMVKKITAVFVDFVTALCLVTVLIEDSQAVCCYPTYGYCPDCSWAYLFTYCGKGSCNIFGCACQGGCVDSCNPIISAVTTGCTCQNRKRDLPDPATGSNAKDDFKEIDSEGIRI